MFNKSDTMREEYCAQIVKIGKIEPIENSDHLSTTMVNNFPIVVDRNEVKEGDIMVYCKMETAINRNFLSVNNQFELGERELNANYKEVQALIDEGKTDEAKTMVGYFNKHGRVRRIKLRGCPSEGCLFSINSIAKWKPKAAKFDFSKCFVPNEDGVIPPFNFDVIDGDLFVKAYIPPMKNSGEANHTPRSRKDSRKAVRRFDRLVDGQFNFHYHTSQLQDNMWKIKPDDVVTVSVKADGTSHITGRLKVKSPVHESVAVKIYKKKLTHEIKMLKKQASKLYWMRKTAGTRVAKLNQLLDEHKGYVLKYGNITSSRHVIMNQYINPTGMSKSMFSGGGNKAIYMEYGDMLYPYIDKGLTVYSEILGFDANNKCVGPHNYDYKCQPCESKIMPYRITFTDDDGVVEEWDVSEVYGWTVNVMKNHPDIKDKMMPINILYHGTLKDLYPDIPVDEDWGRNVVSRMAHDNEHFGMDVPEPMCNKKFPREGIVIRIDGDAQSEAFKLKTDGYKELDAKNYDKGIVDEETAEAYS